MSTAPTKFGGLLIAGKRVLVPGLRIVGPGDHPHCRMSPGDYMLRPHDAWIRQLFAHTTKGLYDRAKGEIILPGAGPGGVAESVAEYWFGNPEHGGAPLVVDTDGTVWCLEDLAKFAAYHATTSNAWSIGLEMFQLANGGVYEATIDATVVLFKFLCELFGIAFQHPSRAYNGDAIDRMKFNGGPDMVGCFGHRDNAWDFVHKTSSRGRGDPGDEFYRRIAAAGSEPMAFETRQDLTIWHARQTVLNEKYGEHLKLDGIAGPGTMAAMRRHGFARGLDIR